MDGRTDGRRGWDRRTDGGGGTDGRTDGLDECRNEAN